MDRGLKRWPSPIKTEKRRRVTSRDEIGSSSLSIDEDDYKRRAPIPDPNVCGPVFADAFLRELEWSEDEIAIFHNKRLAFLESKSKTDFDELGVWLLRVHLEKNGVSFADLEKPLTNSICQTLMRSSPAFLALHAGKEPEKQCKYLNFDWKFMSFEDAGTGVKHVLQRNVQSKERFLNLFPWTGRSITNAYFGTRLLPRDTITLVYLKEDWTSVVIDDGIMAELFDNVSDFGISKEEVGEERCLCKTGAMIRFLH